MLVVWWFLWFFLPCSDAFVNEALHHQMTDSELAYYFQTQDRNAIPDYQVVYLPEIEALEESSTLDYDFRVFEKPVKLKLKKNKKLISPYFQTHILDENSERILEKNPKSCHFLHKDEATIAAISACEPNALQGVILLEDSTIEVHPLSDRLQTFLKEPLLESPEYYSYPHLMKRANFSHNLDDAFPMAGNLLGNNPFLREAASHRPANSLNLELAMFFDEMAYKIFAPFFSHNDEKLQDMLLAYMNGVQALYHHPSLGASIELILVRLDIMKKQPAGLPHYEGERGKLLDSFCAYQSGINQQSDEDPSHWDMAVYISGLDFFAYENGRKSGVTMGLATVGGVCFDKYNCLIAELGTTNVFGKPYPSAGFTSVYILAHEIGHNLGMHHDSVGNSCPKEGYIMSPSRGTNGETLWSTCSAQIITELGWAKCLQDSGKPGRNLEHTKFQDSPGQVYTAKKQCEILLRDRDAVVAPNQELSTICYNLQCRTPHRSGFYFAGPALDGTECRKMMYCYGGECVKKAPPTKVVPGGWGPWKEGLCNSGCIEKSMGFVMKKRECNNPIPVNTDEGCKGSSVEFGTCKDDKICRNKRITVEKYANRKCKDFAKLIPDLDPKGGGLQAPHEEGRVWMGCAIFCRRAETGGFYTPRLELNDLGVSPYFPDGTWCHRENNINYYCLHHHCLPETFRFTKIDLLDPIGEDFPFSQNAGPNSVIPPEIKSYFSLNSKGKPIKTVLKPHESKSKEDDWEIDDYVIIPDLKDRFE